MGRSSRRSQKKENLDTSNTRCSFNFSKGRGEASRSSDPSDKNNGNTAGESPDDTERKSWADLSSSRCSAVPAAKSKFGSKTSARQAISGKDENRTVEFRRLDRLMTLFEEVEKSNLFLENGLGKYIRSSKKSMRCQSPEKKDVEQEINEHMTAEPDPRFDLHNTETSNEEDIRSS